MAWRKAYTKFGIGRKEAMNNQVSLSECATRTGLGSNEMLVGVTPTAMHDSLLESYARDCGKGCAAVRDRIVTDIRAALKLGQSEQAADLLIILRRFLWDRPVVALVRPLTRQAETALFLN
jgi:hypothetical protein